MHRNNLSYSNHRATMTRVAGLMLFATFAIVFSSASCSVVGEELLSSKPNEGATEGAASSSTGAGGTSGTSSTGAGGALVCGTNSPLDANDCPLPCDSCNNGVCIVECGSGSDCKGSTITCPPGLSCLVKCTGLNGCSHATINCADGVPCNVECGGPSSCDSAQINGSTGTVDLSCSGATKVCKAAVLVCGANKCTASCTGTPEPPKVICGSSCACTTC